MPRIIIRRNRRKQLERLVEQLSRDSAQQEKVGGIVSDTIRKQQDSGDTLITRRNSR